MVTSSAADAKNASAPEPPKPQLSVLLLQPECVRYDEEIRKALKSKGFRIRNQAVTRLTKDQAEAYFTLSADVYQSTLSKKEEAEEAKAVESQKPGSGSEEKQTETVDVPKPQRNSYLRLAGSIISHISSDPVVIFTVEKVDAITELMQFVGPFEAPPSQSLENTMRGSYAKDLIRIGLRCSLTEELAQRENNLFFGTGARRASLDVSAGDHLVKKTSRDDLVSEEALMGFLFPPGLQHPKSTGRLFIFGRYGPLDKKHRLRSGEKGTHALSDREIDVMTEMLEREDILSAYGMKGLSTEYENEVLAQADSWMKRIPQMTKKDIANLLESVPRDSSGHMKFTDLQQRIFQAHEDRLNMLQGKLPAVPKSAKRGHRVPDHLEIAPASMFLKDQGISENENCVIVNRMLHRQAFKIAEVRGLNNPEITQNVKLVRDGAKQQLEEDEEKWNENCCLQHTNPGSYTRSKLRADHK